MSMNESRFLNRSSLATLAGLVLASLLLSVPLPAAGNPVPGRWQKVVALDAGTRIIVVTADDARLECRFEAVVDEAMTPVLKDDYRLAGHRIWVGRGEDSRTGVFVSLTEEGSLVGRTDDGKKRQIRLGGIKEVILPRTGEYARDWAVWGAVGGTVGGILLSTAFRDLSPGDRMLVGGAGAALDALGGGIAGAAVGSKGETIYISQDAALPEAGD